MTTWQKLVAASTGFAGMYSPVHASPGDRPLQDAVVGVAEDEHFNNDTLSAHVRPSSHEFWVHRAVAKVNALARLASDWDGHGAVAPDDFARAGATRFVMALFSYGQKPARIAASVDGGYIFHLRREHRGAIVEISNGGGAALLLEHDGQVQKSETVSVDSCDHVASRISAYLQFGAIPPQPADDAEIAV